MNTFWIMGNEFKIKKKIARFLLLREELLYKINDIDEVTRQCKLKNVPADILSFVQHIPELEPKYNYKMQMDNLAYIPITTYSNWYKKQVHRNTRKRIKHRERFNVEIKIKTLDRTLAEGFSEIFNETPIRQGRPYPYYNRPIDGILSDWSPDIDKCDFLVAYFQKEIIGFIKLLYAEDYARASGTITKLSYRSYAPMTFLIDEAVRICAEKGIHYLIYGKYEYSKIGEDSLTIFKKNMGFKKIFIPRYFIPLTIRGWIIIHLNILGGIKDLLPKFILKFLYRLRNYLNR